MVATEGQPSKNKKPNFLNDPSIDWKVLGWALGIVLVFCIFGALLPDTVAAWGNAALGWIVDNAGWLFVLAAAGFVVFVIWLAMSRYGRIPLSANDEKPEFSVVSWCAMMFSAGMGIGLIFFGVYEPVAHAENPAPWLDVQPNTPEAARLGMAYSFFHWALQPWAIYAVVALALGYSTFRKGRGNLISAPFHSLFGRRRMEEKGWGKPIDIWAIVATKFGGATSLGLGALQIAAGIALLTGLGGGFSEQSGGVPVLPLIVIAVLVTLALISAVSGVSRGIKWLSNANLILAVLLAAFVLVVGGAGYILNLGVTAGGAYAFNLIPWSFRNAWEAGSGSWLSSWTIFYWAWWISWAPFVSTFIARISRGRTIRQFVVGVLLVPSVGSAIWFTILGGAGLNLELNTDTTIVGPNTGASEAFFNLLQAYPGFILTAILVVVLTAIFWVSGADASALVLAMLSSRGSIEPKTWLIAMWAVLSAAVAGVLLYVGGLAALQTFNIIVASPFVFIMIGLCWALMVDLRRDPLRRSRAESVGSDDGHGRRLTVRKEGRATSDEVSEPAGADGRSHE